MPNSDFTILLPTYNKTLAVSEVHPMRCTNANGGLSSLVSPYQELCRPTYGSLLECFLAGLTD
jgi:hypothetical protein